MGFDLFMPYINTTMISTLEDAPRLSPRQYPLRNTLYSNVYHSGLLLPVFELHI